MFAPLKTETIQAFLDEARYLDEKPPRSHDMRLWYETWSDCKTSSCAVGDMALRGVCGLSLRGCEVRVNSNELVDFPAVSFAFSISAGEAIFLFACGKVYRHRGREHPHQTAARIRKYLYYRMRKAEILADYETARRREGNWNVCQDAVRYASEEATCT